MVYKTLLEKVFTCLYSIISCHFSLYFLLSFTLAFFQFLLFAMLSLTTGYVHIVFPLHGRFFTSLSSLNLVDAFSFFRPQFNHTSLYKLSLIPPRMPSVPVLCFHILALVTFVSQSTIIIKRLLFLFLMPVSFTRI